MLKSGRLECLTRTLKDGTYTYLKRGTGIECFPCYFQGDVGGSEGQVPFATGGLTNAPHPFRGVVGSDSAWHEGDAPALGVDVVFDLKRACRLSHILIQTPSERLLDSVEIAVKTEAQDPFCVVRDLRARDVGRELGGSTPFPVNDLNCDARYVRLRVRPQSHELCLRYIEIWGCRLEPLSAEEASGLMPSPTKILRARGTFRLPNKAVLARSGSSGAATFNAQFLKKRLPGADVRSRRVRVPDREHLLVFGTESSVAATLRKLPGAPAPDEIGAEGYVLTVGRRAVVLEAASDQGVFYGIQTLAQLVEQGRELDCGTIIDKPHKPLRGVHLFVPSRRQIPFFKRLVTDHLCRLKYNTMFIQVSGGMEYKKHPEINRAWVKFSKEIKAGREDSGKRPTNESMYLARQQNCTHWDLADGEYITQDEMRDLVAFCRQHYFEVIPEVQSLSHCYYLMMPHKEFAEDRHAPYPDTYCPSNPKVYDYVFDVLDEIVDVFQPDMLHIGHDEWYTMCICARCRGKSAADLFARDIKRLHGHLKDKGVKTAMWCDRLLPRHGGLGARFAVITQNYFCDGREIMSAAEKLPKDILMLNWTNFINGAEDLLREKGFEQIFGNFTPNFPDWERRSACSTIPGAEVGSWNAVGESSFAQGILGRMVLCSHALWSGAFYDPQINRESKLIRQLVETRRRLSRQGSTWLDTESSRVCVDLAGRTNLSWTVQNAVSDLTVHGLPLRLAVEGGAVKAVAVTDPAAGPEGGPSGAGPVPVNRKARSLFFLHACTDNAIHRNNSKAFGGPHGDKVGEYVVTYRDGEKRRVPVRYGEQVATARYSGTLAEPPVSYDAVPVWQGMDGKGEKFTLYVYEWLNPRPDQAVRNVTMKAAAGKTDVALCLFALTVVR